MGRCLRPKINKEEEFSLKMKCQQCGNQLTGKQTKFCSKECRLKSQNASRRKYDKVCPVCGNEYKAARQEQIYCCLSCKASYENSQLKGERARNWKGGRIIRPDGYVMVYAPDSPQAHRDGYAYEHRLVADRKYPFTIPSHFPVHHLNGDRGDNRPKNLQTRGSQGRHLREYHMVEGIPGYQRTMPQQPEVT